MAKPRSRARRCAYTGAMNVRHASQALRHAMAICLIALPFALHAPASDAAPLQATSKPAEASLDARFRAIYEREWKWRQEQRGASGEQDSESTRMRLPDVSPQAQADYDVRRLDAR